MHSLLAVVHCGKRREDESAKVTAMIAEARERCVCRYRVVERGRDRVILAMLCAAMRCDATRC